MTMQDDDKAPKGRNWDQITQDGTGSVASVGTGGTGDIGRMSGDADGSGGNAQSATRTDDWLSDGSEEERRQGFRPSEPGAIETGMEGINSQGSKGNKQ
jgi:hypothetical protein